MSNSYWPANRIETLLTLAPAHTPREIATAIGVSRNAVIGKPRRLGIPVKDATGALPDVRNRAADRAAYLAAERLRRARQRADARAERVAQAAAALDRAKASTADAAVRSRPCAIIDLQDALCHSPIGDPRDVSHRYCGAPTSAGRPYCARHATIACTDARARAISVLNGARPRISPSQHKV